MINQNGDIQIGLFDYDGNIITRTPYTHPYTYDCYVIYDARPEISSNYIIYSDRLFQNNIIKFNESMKKSGLTGQMFYDADPKKVVNFLRYYYDNNSIELSVIMQGVKVSTGCPYWIFFMKFNTLTL